ncbi:hypothetical protein [Baaleninema sp.]|uniref:hypothetical protein n=1 Tax=Baaleninema sp. TaxID=3101197 RepID=UPI003CFEF252
MAELKIDRDLFDRIVRFLHIHAETDAEAKAILKEIDRNRVQVKFPPNMPDSVKRAFLNRLQENFRQYPPRDTAEAYQRVRALGEEMGFSTQHHKPN